MLVVKEKITDVPIISLQTGGELAKTQKPIIDPRRLAIVGFYCEGAHLDIDPAILHLNDIREIGSLGYIVDSADVFMSPQDLVRLKAVLEYNFDLIGKQVYEQTGRKVGKVTNYTIDTNSFYITKLQVQPGLLQSFKTAATLIGRTQIVEITDSRIIVASPTVTNTVHNKQLMQKI